MSREARNRRERTFLGVLLAPTLFWLIIFFMLPLLVILVYSFLTKQLPVGIAPPFHLGNYIRFADLLYIQIFWRSFVIAGLTTLICLLLGYPISYWMSRQPPRARNTLLLLLMIPFWTNFVVRTYSMKFFLFRQGPLNNILLGTGLLKEPLAILFTPTAVVIGLVYGWAVEMVLPLYASMVDLDRSLIEAAQDLYASRLKVFLRVILPLTAPGIAAGSILVFVPSLGAYITPDLLGGSKTAMIGNIIADQFGAAQDWAFGSAISFVLMAIMLVATVLYFRILRREAELR
jgi:spermidine/putrescine transport system permease protein